MGKEVVWDLSAEIAGKFKKTAKATSPVCVTSRALGSIKVDLRTITLDVAESLVAKGFDWIEPTKAADTTKK